MSESTSKRVRLLRDLSRDPGILILAYPYARTWREISRKSVQQSWSEVPPGEHAAMHVHIPFCRTKCTYCDFLAYYGRSDSEIERYLDLLRQDIRVVAGMAGHVAVESMEFGGGTPSLLSVEQVAAIMDGVRARFRFSPDADVTMEVLPDTSITTNLMAGWKREGITRLSFGVQFLDDDLKKKLNREDTTEEILRILRSVREAGFDDFSVDLMCGLPEQTEESWRHTCQEILRLHPPHVCVFPVSVRHEGIALYNYRAALLRPSRSRQTYEEAYQFLLEAGYQRTTRHNFRLGKQDFTYERLMADLAPVIGLGAHSISQAKDCIYKNHSHLGKYETAVSTGEPPLHTGHIFPEEEKPYNYAVRRIEHLRLDGKDFAARFGRSLREAFPEEISLLEEFGLARMNGADLELTPDGVYYTAAVKRTFFHPSAWDRFESMRPEEFKLDRGIFDAVESPASVST
ncbi:MAG: coproporphyrinogen III oxidase family protein [Candidatus Methylomirabilis oxygeniifera]|uniref:Putative Coproporphyrinogen dehydrogenase n=1 Tax=Methylomirabilis oxygeniifera TaxID=671143 RepID=D5MH51_METO1|nr:MAG: coproporphyrinogen III oxidase family protein [Candidatus Methylomirabilis oxyfera]CBE69082.1 putative Coproporphyrinogen dehydrogenase [Candidatus Methylomirabilis oxyfera]